ncbi:hypothetical protein C8F01DRAFT_1131787 [Mycena amicta]|nr:hypothetical protein C8F01DRAFT_1131787 [Mycena amicta]
MLEIEMHSPSFRTTRSVSAKRARSPDSPSQRPAKRPSLAIGQGPPENTYFYDTRSSASSSRQSSEDWVKQAGGLSIESPLFPTPTSATVPQVEQQPPDDGMAVDTEEQYMVNRPFLTPLHTPQSHRAYHHESLPVVPSINLQPATPQMISSRTPIHYSPTAMHVSPTSAFGSPTKRRFMMGPRASCEKCRLGVKGHWAHWD